MAPYSSEGRGDDNIAEEALAIGRPRELSPPGQQSDAARERRKRGKRPDRAIHATSPVAEQ